jgi:biopolymer transport protein ExbD
MIGLSRHSRRSTPLKLVTDISVTPLLDLVFILLFAFMVAMPLVMHLGGEEKKADDKAEASPVSVVDASGRQVELRVREGREMTWAGEVIADAELEQRLVLALNEEPGLGLVVKLDAGESVDDLMRLMRRLRVAGVQRVAVLTVQNGAEDF